MDLVHWGFLLSLQILLYPLGRGHVVLLLEGGVEDGLALESGSLCDAFDGGGQVCSPSQQGDGMGQTEFISIRREGGIQFLIEEVGDPDMGNIECLREVM